MRIARECNLQLIIPYKHMLAELDFYHRNDRGEFGENGYWWPTPFPMSTNTWFHELLKKKKFLI